jgi:hypothetical protein
VAVPVIPSRKEEKEKKKTNLLRPVQVVVVPVALPVVVVPFAVSVPVIALPILVPILALAVIPVVLRPVKVAVVRVVVLEIVRTGLQKRGGIRSGKKEGEKRLQRPKQNVRPQWQQPYKGKNKSKSS